MPERALTVTFLGNTAGLETAIKRTAAQLNGLQAAGASMQGVGRSLTRNLTVPILAVAGASADMAVKFQASMEQLHTQANVSQSAIAGLSRGVLNMAGAVGTSPQKLAEGLYHVASSLNATLPAATRSATELRVLKVAAEGAAVGHADLVDVTNALDAAVVSGIKGVQNFSGAMGSLNSVVGAGDMTMQNLADALSTGLLAPMKTYGLTLQDVGGALATFGDNNIRGQEAATKLVSAVRIMAAPSKAAAKELGAVGLTTLQLANDMRQGGIVQALQDLRTHLTDAGLTASQQGLVISRAFGGRQSTGVQVLLSQLDRLQAKTVQVGDGAKNFGESWAATQQTAAFRTQAALATMKADLTSFGNDALPTLLAAGSTIVHDVDKIARAFTSLPKGAQDAIITGGLVVAGIGPALKIVGATTSLVGRAERLAGWAAKLIGPGGLAGDIVKGSGVKGLSTVGTMEVGTLIAKSMVGGGGLPGPGGGGLSTAEREAITVGEGAAGGAGTLALLRAGLAYGVERAVPVTAAAAVGVAVGLELKKLFPQGISPPAALSPQDIAALGEGLTNLPSARRVLSGHGGGTQEAPGLPTATAIGGVVPASAHQALNQFTLDSQRAQGAVERFGAGAAKVLANLGVFARMSGDQRWRLADSLGAELLRGKVVTSRGIRNIIGQLDLLPPGAKRAGETAMLTLVGQLETKGAVALGTTARLQYEINAQFAKMARGVGAQTARMVADIDKLITAIGSLNFTKPGLGLPGFSNIGAAPSWLTSPAHHTAKHASAATLAAIGAIPTPTIPAAPKLPALKIPVIPIPPAPTAIPSQLVGAQIRMAELANQLASAQNAANVSGQKHALSAELALEHTWLTKDKGALDRVNSALRDGHLSLAKHKQLLQDKLAILQEIGTVISNIGQTQQSLGQVAGVGGSVPKVYYHDHPRTGRSSAAGEAVRAGAGAGIRKGGLTINGGLHVHGSGASPQRIVNDFYLQVRPYLTAPG